MNATTAILGSPGLELSSNAAGSEKPERLHKAAQQFEALLISEMLKTAHADSEDGWLGSGGSTGSDSAMQMAESQLAEALSSGKGLGLASVIERSMAPRLAQSGAAPAGPHSNTAAAALLRRQQNFARSPGK